MSDLFHSRAGEGRNQRQPERCLAAAGLGEPSGIGVKGRGEQSREVGLVERPALLRRSFGQMHAGAKIGVQDGVVDSGIEQRRERTYPFRVDRGARQRPGRVGFRPGDDRFRRQSDDFRRRRAREFFEKGNCPGSVTAVAIWR